MRPDICLAARLSRRLAARVRLWPAACPGPAAAWGHYRRGKQDLDKAVADFVQAVSIDPLYAPGYWARALTYHQSKKYKDARADYDKCIEVDPNGLVGAMAREYLKILGNKGK